MINTWDFFWHIVIILSYVLILGLIIFKFKSKSMKLNLKLNKKDLNLALASIGLIILLYLLAVWTNVLTPVAYNRSALKAILAILYFIFLISPAEEIIFRGIIMNFLLKRSKVIPAIIYSSLIFGLAHLANGAKGLNPFLWSWEIALLSIVGGLIFAYVFYKTKSIINSIIVHATASLIYYFIFGGLRGLL